MKAEQTQNSQNRHSAGRQLCCTSRIRPNIRHVAAIAAFALAMPPVATFSVAVAAESEPLRMVFRDKPPYSYQENGVQKGFLLEKTKRILARAKIESTFAILPPKRIFQEIQDSETQVCSFGWYKIPEREKYASFSVAMHQDRPQVVLASPKSVNMLRKHKSLKSMMANPALVIALADGVSYGPELDSMLAVFPGKIDRALVSPLQVAEKVAKNRADLMFIDQSDYDYMVETDAAFRSKGLIVISYPDMPVGLKRYILCSRKVSDQTMRRINAAIAADGAR
jgi:uncharacterized protein (TIGR02285 family)